MCEKMHNKNYEEATMNLYCSECGREIANGAKYCPDCGTPQPIICPECDVSLSEGTNYCPHCGFSLENHKPKTETEKSSWLLNIIIAGSILVIVEGMSNILMAEQIGNFLSAYTTAEVVTLGAAIGVIGGIVSLIVSLSLKYKRIGKMGYVLTLVSGILGCMPGGLSTSFLIIIPSIVSLKKS